MKLSLRRSHRDIAASLQVSAGAVGGLALRAKALGLDWERVKGLSEEELEALLFPRSDGARGERPLPDFAEVHRERMKAGVTLELLQLEYIERHPDGYGYTQFCEHYRRWLSTRGLTMRQEHHPGDKLFVDYSGKKLHVVDGGTGELVEVELFVAVLGASNYTYAEATATQRVADFVASHVRAFEFFGGVPRGLVPDQLKSAVIGASRYEPELQRTYEDMAEHYGTAVVPARPRKPRDKAKVEVAVQIVQRWVLARLRNQRFFSLEALNARIRELLVDLNQRRMRRYEASRRELFEQVDRPALRALPSSPYTFATWSKARITTDYHVVVDGHAYSVPHRLVGQVVETRSTTNTVEVLRCGKRVAVHVRSDKRGGKTTTPEHLPVAHRSHLDWTPERILAWASKVGGATEALVNAILDDRPHPEQGYRSCLGLLRLERRFGPERLERACARALAAGVRAYTPVQRMLVNGLDRLEPAALVDEPLPEPHENLRGATYYN